MHCCTKISYWPLSILGIGHLDAHSHFQAMLGQAHLGEDNKKWWPEKEKEKEIRKKKQGKEFYKKRARQEKQEGRERKKTTIGD